MWGMADGLMVSNCGAVGDTMATQYIKDRFDGTPETQVAQAVKAGCDYNCGSYYSAHLASALALGKVTVEDVDRSTSRLLKKCFQLGLFDPVNMVPYARYGREQLDSVNSRQLALEGATQSIVLLKNDPTSQLAQLPTAAAAAAAPTPLLPLAASTKVAVIGPHFNASDAMLSNYKGSNNVVYRHTPLTAITKRGNVVGSAPGSALSGADESGFPAAKEAATNADIALVFLGLHPQWFDADPDGDAREGEDLDRFNITLPDIQLKLLQAISGTGTPVVLVLINGGQVAIPWAKEHVPAVVEAFYPGQFGGDAIASVLYGDISPSGRLPYTMYDADFTARRPSIGDLSLSANGGITYQHYTGVPLWSFGWGLSYTTFRISWAAGSEATIKHRSAPQRNGGRGGRPPQQGGHASNTHLLPKAYNVTVTNTGTVTSDVTILAFVTLEREEGVVGAAAIGTVGGSGDGAPVNSSSSSSDQPLPLRKLCSFCRLRAVAPNVSVGCELPIAANVVATYGRILPGTNAAGNSNSNGSSNSNGDGGAPLPTESTADSAVTSEAKRFYSVSLELGDGTTIRGHLELEI
jgi:hypothetical protein